MKDEAKRLKTIRKALALTQSVFAQGLGLKQAPYSMIESGKVGISSEVIKKLIGYYKVNPVFLFQGHQEMFLPEGSTTTVPQELVDPAKLPAQPKNGPAPNRITDPISFSRLSEIRRKYQLVDPAEKNRMIEELIGACEQLKDVNDRQKDKIIQLMNRLQAVIGNSGH